MTSLQNTAAPAQPLSEGLRKSDFLVALALLSIMAILAATRATHYLFFHTLAELFAIVMSFSIFVLAWLSSRYLVNGYLIVLGASYAAVGFVDVLHTLTFRGMNLFPGVSTNYPTQFWLTARFLEALALLCAPFLIDRKPGFALVAAGFAALASAACTAVLYQWFPATFVEGSGLTPFKIYSEYVIIVMLLVGLLMLYRFRRRFESRIFMLLVISLMLAVVTEFCFTRYISFYDFTNELGHYSRFLSSAFAFMAIVLSGVRQPFELIFRESEQRKRELEALNTRLQHSEAFNASVFNSVADSIAVLDLQGVILAVNAPWRKFALANGAQAGADGFVGQNYLGICAAAIGQVGGDEAALAATGIRAVLSGTREEFEMEYPCHSPDQKRWFHLEVRPFQAQQRGVIVAHTDITAARVAQEAVRESQERYRLLFAMSADAIMLTAPDGQIFHANPAACRMFGRSEEEICRLGRECVVDTSDPQLAVSLDVRQRTGKFSGENVFMRKDGSKFVGEVSTSLFTDKDGNARTSMIIRDISERKRIEAALRDSEARMSAVFQASPIGIVISRLSDGKILDLNDACLRLYRYTRDEALGRTVAELSTYVQPEQRVELLKLLREHGFVAGFLIDFRRHDQTVGVLEMSGRIITLEGVPCMLAMLSDVTERARSQALMLEQAFHDALTQLPNRRLLGNRLQQAMIAAKRSACYAALMYLDLDNFKPLNDCQGHEVGDLLLIEVAARLKSCVREMDTVARVGGDEFVVMLGELSADLAASTEQAAAVAEKIRRAVSVPYVLLVQRDGQADGTVQHHCSASIGVVLFVNDEIGQDDILNRADVAMYQAKHAGRNLIRFYAPI